jgi:vacuolar-type H+-ATPase subunit I/STV1
MEMNKYLKFTSIFLLLVLVLASSGYGQRLKKVRASKKIVAYDINGNVIDSLTKDLSKQAGISKYLDQIQVELHEIEKDLKRAGDDSKKTEASQKKKEELLTEKLETIQQIQKNKDNLVTEYYIVIEAFRSKKNAKNAMVSWHNKGQKVFLFRNKVRKWYYICASVQRSYTNTIRKQYALQKQGVESWIYYWAE